jgi:hypothetical protein
MRGRLIARLRIAQRSAIGSIIPAQPVPALGRGWLSLMWPHLTSWKCFDLTTIHQDLRGFFGAVHHKNYVYFLPHCKEEDIYHGIVVRHDRRLSFDDLMSWSFLNTAEYHPMSKGFMGCCITGDIMTLSPYETTTHGHSGVACSINLELAPFKQHFTNEEAAK